uniref:Uncharacterized protein n=1 Tax=Meloidogyne incognita TaxID=6306 RepID=A0A914LNT5_MELIC
MPRTYQDELQFIERISPVEFRIKKGFVPNMNNMGSHRFTWFILYRNFVQYSSITLIFVPIDSARRALSNDMHFGHIHDF